MPNVSMRRLTLAVIGGLGGLGLYLLIEGVEQSALSERMALLMAIWLISFIGTILAMSGRLALHEAVLRALPLSILVAGLAMMVGARWSDPSDIFSNPPVIIALFAVASLPIPMLMAAKTHGNWRDYSALFEHSWGIAVRGLVAVFFTLLLWLVIWLSDTLLRVVGLNLINDLIDVPAVPFIITGCAFGLTVAVVIELSDHITPKLLLRLLRLLLPFVTLVSVIFVVTAAIWGFDVGYGNFSPAMTLLTMALAGASLIAVTVDADEAASADHPLLLWSARVMAILLPILGLLAAWALWQRLVSEGLTPERLFAGLMIALNLGFGLAYALAVLRGAGWRARIRAVNPWGALTVVCASILWLTPLFNAEKISAADQAARFIDGRKSPSAFSRWDFNHLGLAGEKAIEDIRAAATASKDQLMLDALEGEYAADTTVDRSALVADVEAVMPVQPESASGTRHMYLSMMEVWELEDLRQSCQLDASGQAGCLLIVADLLPSLPGEEAILVVDRVGWVSIEGVSASGTTVGRRSVTRVDGTPLNEIEARALLEEWRKALPPVAPAQINQLGTGSNGVVFLP